MHFLVDFGFFCASTRGWIENRDFVGGVEVAGSPVILCLTFCLVVLCMGCGWGFLMYKFSKISEERLGTCHYDIQRVVRLVMSKQVMDFSVLCGHRGKEDQNRAVREGHSRLRWPRSRHNRMPSLAVDLCAYPIDDFDDDNTARTKSLAHLVIQYGKGIGVPLFWGGRWQSFPDIYHFQLPSTWVGSKEAREYYKS